MRLVIDHSRIPTEHLAIELGNAERSPDAQVYPWRDLYPLVGQTVYYDGQLWTVASKGWSPATFNIVGLVGCGHDGQTSAMRCELRPSMWTQADEDFTARRARGGDCDD